MPKSFKFEVHTTECAEGVYTANGQRFSTSKQADDAGKDLMRRWMLATDYRVVPSTDSPNQPEPEHCDDDVCERRCRPHDEDCELCDPDPLAYVEDSVAFEEMK
jgi:hypothetical protein